MSYYGIRCGHCGTRGHNRLGCPERKKEALHNPEGYTARALARETATRRAAIENRKCSYCCESGHNRRSCATLKADEAKVKKKQSSYVDLFLATCERKGLGPGAMFKFIDTRGGSWRHTAEYKVALYGYLTSPTWETVSFLNKEFSNNEEGSYLPWRISQIRAFDARLVGYEQLPPEALEDEYFKPAQPGEPIGLTIGDVAPLIEKAFRPSQVDTLDCTRLALKSQLEMVSRVYEPFPLTTTGDKAMPHTHLPSRVVETFSFSPPKNAKAHQRQRLSAESWLWPKLDEGYSIG